MLQKLKSELREIKRGTSGRRFTEHYIRSKRSEDANGSVWKKWGYVAAGLLLLIVGLLLSVPPGVPGFLLWIPGLALLAARSKTLAMLLDRLESWGKKLWRRLRGVRSHS
jgi:sulfite exporter TauE/SafE